MREATGKGKIVRRMGAQTMHGPKRDVPRRGLWNIYLRRRDLTRELGWVPEDRLASIRVVIREVVAKELDHFHAVDTGGDGVPFRVHSTLVEFAGTFITVNRGMSGRARYATRKGTRTYGLLRIDSPPVKKRRS